jgi:hypothetical protein
MGGSFCWLTEKWTRRQIARPLSARDSLSVASPGSRRERMDAWTRPAIIASSIQCTDRPPRSRILVWTSGRARGTGKRAIIIQACIGRIGELQSMGHLEWNRGTSVADELYSSRTVDYSLTTRILACLIRVAETSAIFGKPVTHDAWWLSTQPILDGFIDAHCIPQALFFQLEREARGIEDKEQIES